ncbi:TonB-dependent receptor domain-containing protein [Dyadobacter subterraneus]|uniref:TonB-dependent receptor n=1 Tax=Dyadobacter subterraneus TaxID=2773304 RepID=A0ABR9WKI1_9BACT|nr:TonB-dependent receptor [Dyadobacter subterraneus]MBE9466016.1 TonB-dependent receptor [Dyadobacter subterraneus]
MNLIFTKRISCLAMIFLLFSRFAFSQTNISGKVVEGSTNEPLIGVSIQVKGKIIGTITDADGKFNLVTNSVPPFALIVSSVGFESQEINITGGISNIEVKLVEQAILGKELVVSASRVEESVMRSPVSIEKIDIRTIRETPQASFYDALQNLKGVEMSTQSLTFKSVSTRGFGANGNTRVVQLIDGMDNQAPGLNFPVGNVAGIPELDVESVEILPGAASALYGPNAINGIILMNSKSPFTYQGLSAYGKSGVMSASNRTKTNTPFYDVGIRYAKAFNNRLAFKVNASYLTAKDWQATDYRDQSLIGTTLENNNNNVQNNPYYDGVNRLGDVGVNVYNVLYGNGIPGTGANGTSAALGAIYSTQIAQAGNLTLPQLLGGQTPLQQLDIARSIFSKVVPQYYLNAPGYAENSLTNYPAKSLKLNASLHYRLNDNVEAILQANWGKGSAVYTGADRYNIQNFSIGQYKAEVKGSNFFVRAYMTRENSGDAYAMGVLGSLVSQSYLQTALGVGLPSFLNTALTQYGGALLQAYQAGLAGGLSQQQAIQAASTAANAYAGANSTQWLTTALAPGIATANQQFLPGGTQFASTVSDIKTKPIPNGAKFLDKSNLYHAEGMYNFTKLVDPKVIELIAGANYRIYDLNSGGTLFETQDGTPTGKEFNIREYGAYTQASKNFNDVFKLTASVRYDKNMNFKGQFSPRISGVYTVAKNHNFRASFQRGFRIPTTQNQYINLLTPSVRLVGGLPLFREKYNMVGNAVYEQTAITSGNIQDGTLKPYKFREWQPERVQTYEIGYKGVIGNKLYIDAFYYYNRFLTFDGITVLLQRKDPNGPLTDLLDPTKRNAYSMPVNATQTVKNSGWGVGLDYVLGKGYTFNGNLTQNMLNNNAELLKNDPSFVTFFNSPKYRFNLGFSNRDINRTGWGFGVTFRHQSNMVWQATVASIAANIQQKTVIPAYSTLDAQISRKVSSIKSIIKIGGTNLTGKLYTTGWANPSVGAMYYVSITFDELLN